MGSLELTPPRVLFASDRVEAGEDLGGSYHTYAVSRDGQRFLIPRAPSSAGAAAATMPDPIAGILNWAAGVK